MQPLQRHWACKSTALSWEVSRIFTDIELSYIDADVLCLFLCTHMNIHTTKGGSNNDWWHVPPPKLIPETVLEPLRQAGACWRLVEPGTCMKCGPQLHE